MNKITVEITSQKVLTEYDIRKALEFLYEEDMNVIEVSGSDFQDVLATRNQEAYEL